MEGTTGMTIETPLVVVNPAPRAPEIQTASQQEVRDSSLAAKQDTQSVQDDANHTESEKTEKLGKQPDEKTVTKEDGEQIDPVEEKFNEIQDLLEKDDLLTDSQKEILRNFLPKNVKDADGESEKGTKLVDALAELTRLITLIFALLALLIFHQKDTYSGKDLVLSDEAPENEGGKEISFGENSKNSWKNFKKDVEKIPEMPFEQFMAAVLEANAKNSVRALKPTKEDSQGKKRMQKPTRASRKKMAKGRTRRAA